jgi:hypothetical protein
MVARRRKNSPLRWAQGAVALALIGACVPPSGVPDDEPLTVPFAVSDYFSPTGYLGDGATVGVVNMVAAACTTRAPNAVGDCYKVTYTPPLASTYAGVYWQYPGNNWGGYPGHTVEQGATQATVWAMGTQGGEQVSFKAGGIADPPDGTEPYVDSVSASGPTVSLTKEWQQFSVSLTGADYYPEGATTYSSVLGGFAWIVIPPMPNGAPSTEPIVFYLDNIRWTQ